jgi:hypothetical protein
MGRPNENASESGRPIFTSPVGAAEAALHGGARFGRLLQHQLRVLIQEAAGLRRLHAARAALQQRRLHLRFERGDMLAQGRLRDVQHPGGARQAAEVNDLHEIRSCLRSTIPLLARRYRFCRWRQHESRWCARCGAA